MGGGRPESCRSRLLLVRPRAPAPAAVVGAAEKGCRRRPGALASGCREDKEAADRETEAQGGSPCRRASRGRPWSCLLSRDPCPRCAGPQGQAPQFSLRGAGKGPGHRSGPAQKQRPDRLPRSQEPGRGRRPEGDGAGPAGLAPISAGKLTSEAGRSGGSLARARGGAVWVSITGGAGHANRAPPPALRPGLRAALAASQNPGAWTPRPAPALPHPETLGAARESGQRRKKQEGDGACPSLRLALSTLGVEAAEAPTRVQGALHPHSSVRSRELSPGAEALDLHLQT
nr:PREDICTED: dapper homolog 3-like [Equus przewalskii]